MTATYSDAYQQRFGGTARLYGQQSLELFSQAHVCVMGGGSAGANRHWCDNAD
jgi:tRNA A37 threonylcarbamoyladenosine dehydratase